MSSAIAGFFLASCLFEASAANNLPPKILLSVIAVEGGRPGLVSKNKNGTVDLGIMQINDAAWLNHVSNRLFAGDKKKAFESLRDDPCFNISVGAWILASSIKKENGDIWQGVGRYHSNTPDLKRKYINLVQRKHKSMFGEY